MQRKTINRTKKMKKFRSNLKLTILSILAIVAYIFMVGYSFSKEIDDFWMGLNAGISQAEMESETAETKQSEEVYYLNLKPKNGHFSFPDSVKNTKNNNFVKYRSHYIKAQTAFDNDTVKTVQGLQTTSFILASILLIFIIYIPILFFKFIFSLIDEIIFDNKNIKLLRRLGIVLITFYLLYFAFDWCSTLINKSLFEFENYKIAVTSDADFIWVVLGIVVLLFAEILSRGYTIKEEQDLTI